MKGFVWRDHAGNIQKGWILRDRNRPLSAARLTRHLALDEVSVEQAITGAQNGTTQRPNPATPAR